MIILSNTKIHIESEEAITFDYTWNTYYGIFEVSTVNYYQQMSLK